MAITTLPSKQTGIKAFADAFVAAFEKAQERKLKQQALEEEKRQFDVSQEAAGKRALLSAGMLTPAAPQIQQRQQAQAREGATIQSNRQAALGAGMPNLASMRAPSPQGLPSTPFQPTAIPPQFSAVGNVGGQGTPFSPTAIPPALSAILRQALPQPQAPTPAPLPSVPPPVGPLTSIGEQQFTATTPVAQQQSQQRIDNEVRRLDLLQEEMNRKTEEGASNRELKKIALEIEQGQADLNQLKLSAQLTPQRRAGGIGGFGPGSQLTTPLEDIQATKQALFGNDEIEGFRSQLEPGEILVQRGNQAVAIKRSELKPGDIEL